MPTGARHTPARAADLGGEDRQQDRQAPPAVEHPVEERVVGVVVVVVVAPESRLAEEQVDDHRVEVGGSAPRRERVEHGPAAPSTVDGVVVGGDQQHRLVERQDVGRAGDAARRSARRSSAVLHGQNPTGRYRPRRCTPEPSPRRTPDKPAVVMDDGRDAHLRELDEAARTGSPTCSAPPGSSRATTSPSCSRTGPRCSSSPGRPSAPGSTTRRRRPACNADELEYIVDDCGARVLDRLGRHRRRGRRDRRPRTSSCGSSSTARADGWESLDDAVAAHPATPIADEAEGADMLYSSGTTGRPEGREDAAARQATFPPQARWSARR